MIFNNLGLSDLSLELELFLWQIVFCALPKDFLLTKMTERYLSKLLLDILALLPWGTDSCAVGYAGINKIYKPKPPTIVA